MKTINKLLLLLSALILGACSHVEAGNVGVKVYKLGGSKGVDSEVLTPGRYWIGFNEELHIFPTFQQNYTWVKPDAKSDAPDESITFQTVEGMQVEADVGISYHLRQDKISDIFQKYRRGINEITDTFLRNHVRDAMNAQGSTLPVESVYGNGKVKFMEAVKAQVVSEVQSIGIEIDEIYLIGSFRLPQTVVAALNAKLEATQKAQQRENEVAEAKAQAAKDVAHAQGVADSNVLKAKGEAEAILVNAEAQAKANKIVAASVTRELIDYNNVQRWNGVLPSTVLGNGSSVLLSR